MAHLSLGRIIYRWSDLLLPCNGTDRSVTVCNLYALRNPETSQRVAYTSLVPGQWLSLSIMLNAVKSLIFGTACTHQFQTAEGSHVIRKRSK